MRSSTDKIYRNREMRWRRLEEQGVVQNVERAVRGRWEDENLLSRSCVQGIRTHKSRAVYVCVCL